MAYPENMSRHVMECLGLSRVTVEDGKVVDVTEPKVRYCPLFAKRRGMEELNRDSIRENIEFRIQSFGMCSEDRVTEMDNFLNFGISETLCSALMNGKIDAAVIAADGCGPLSSPNPDWSRGWEAGSPGYARPNRSRRSSKPSEGRTCWTRRRPG